ncbi:HU family DNA-binding protein [Cellulosimicrobium arenosum]|uniref:HU family DNA-binding protein n=2 Tax=Cellulosimicrobium arenosum TaxID=2708133 RepID=A0A927G7Y1_9MICO|nr:HU family DNA-binding protein [Cellulosimicrobium arenosum]MBD8078365.1 HU family DNA-binding protein [Cellulosimicrobium arenosum]
MNKAELVQAVAARAGSSPAEARRHVDAVFEEIVTGVADGERVSILGFGTFDSATRASRTARNPQTGAAIDVPAATVPRFRIGAGFKSRVAGTSAVAAAPASRKRSAEPTAPTGPDKKAKKAKKSGSKPSGKSSKAATKPPEKSGKKAKSSKKKSGKKSKK